MASTGGTWSGDSAKAEAPSKKVVLDGWKLDGVRNLSVEYSADRYTAMPTVKLELLTKDVQVTDEGIFIYSHFTPKDKVESFLRMGGAEGPLTPAGERIQTLERQVAELENQNRELMKGISPIQSGLGTLPTISKPIKNYGISYSPQATPDTASETYADLVTAMKSMKDKDSDDVPF